MRGVARGLLVAGTGITVLGMAKAHAVTHGYDLTASSQFAWTFTYIALLLVAAYGAGLPDLTRTRRVAAVAAVASTAAASLAISLLQLILGSQLLPRAVVFIVPAVLLPFYLLCTSLASDGRSRAVERDRIVLVARRPEAVRFADELAADPERPAALVGVLDPGAARSPGDGVHPLEDLVAATEATAVALDRAAQADESVVAQAARLHESGVRVRTLSLCYDQWLGKLPISELERVALMFDIGEVHRALYGRVKRIVDLGAAACGLVVLAAVAPLVAVGNVFANRGPLLYRQARVGRGGGEFEILKFRTMVSGSPDTGWTLEGDPRITRFGAWLRRTHLDEMPQVLNILRGDLSLVGPRPEQPRYVDELAEKIPFYRMRHLVRPGLTGWAQVKYPYGASDSDALEKLQYEFYYLRHQSIALDLRIIGRTIRAVVGRNGR